MDLLWRLIYSSLIGLLLWVLHKYIGSYPAQLPRSEKPHRDIWIVMLLWVVALLSRGILMVTVMPWLNRSVSDPFLREISLSPFLTLVYVALPLSLLRRKGLFFREFRITLKTQSLDVSIFAILFGVLSGCIAYLNGQTVVGLESHHWGDLFVLFYNNAFIEEFYFRGVMQSLLERALGQMKALLWGGILYGSVHIMLDISILSDTGVLFVLFAVLLQTMAGWLLGMIFMKTRSLWPGIICHYLVNWLPSILTSLLG